jgi:menaquinone-dependent protoporphyrinogen IX oxidase
MAIGYTVVEGCLTEAFKPVLAGWIEKHWDRMKGKRVALFTTLGVDPATDPVKEWVEKVLSERVRSGVRVFPLAGRFDYAKLRGPHKAMIWIAANVLRNKGVRNQMKTSVDGVAKEKLGELLAFLKGSG